ncbi:MAG: hypothetical protein ACRD3W_08860, partial [Terriglobales bacterium]
MTTSLDGGSFVPKIEREPDASNPFYQFVNGFKAGANPMTLLDHRQRTKVNDAETFGEVSGRAFDLLAVAGLICVGKGVANRLVFSDGRTASLIEQSSLVRAVNRPFVPNVSLNAEPHSGYMVSYEGSEVTLGGTAAVAPLAAGTYNLLRQSSVNAARLGFKMPGVRTSLPDLSAP